MRKQLISAFLAICLTLPFTTHAVNNVEGAITVIEEQPEGELRIYTRSGKVVKEVVEYDDSHYLTTASQSGTINIVFANDGSVYFQRPVSESYYDGWVKGTLSADGKTITVPVGQFTAYTKSFNMAVQVWMMRYDETQKTYVADESISNIVYTIDDDGAIHLQGTGGTVGTDSEIPMYALGCVNRCFGDTFSYLDFEWHNNGSDFETTYLPAGLELPVPPDNLQTQSFIATTGMMDGIEWDVLNTTVNMGFDGDDVWLQGICHLLPQAWVKGTRSGNTITFSTGQVLGSYLNKTVYLVGAKSDNEGNPVITDIVFTYDKKGTYTSYTDIFASSAKDDVAYLMYYMGMTLSDKAERTVVAPAGLQTETYTMAYQEPDDNGYLRNKTATVQVGIDHERGAIFIQGITPLMPDAYIMGALDENNGRVAFASPQYLGTYSDEETAPCPIYFQAYNGNTGELVSRINFAYDIATRALAMPSAVVSIGINKTGLLSLQNMYNIDLMPDNTVGITDREIVNRKSVNSKSIDLLGRRVNGQSSMVNGQSSMVNGQRSMVNGQWSMVNGQIVIQNGKKLLLNR